MYVRPQNFRYPTGVRLPENYSGNTFRESTEPPEEQEVRDEPTADTAAEAAENSGELSETAALLTEKSNFGLRLSSIFGKSGIGTEELLILALILLLADGDDNEDMILFLLLLFFIK